MRPIPGLASAAQNASSSRGVRPDSELTASHIKMNGIHATHQHSARSSWFGPLNVLRDNVGNLLQRLRRSP